METQKKKIESKLVNAFRDWNEVNTVLKEIEDENWKTRNDYQSESLGKILVSLKPEIQHQSYDYCLRGIFALSQYIVDKEQKYTTFLMTAKTFGDGGDISYIEYQKSEGSTPEESFDNLVSRLK